LNATDVPKAAEIAGRSIDFVPRPAGRSLAPSPHRARWMPIKPSWRFRESRSSSTHQRAGVWLRAQTRFNSLEKPMPAYVIFDVDIRDADQYREFMTAVKPALEAVGARYLVRGGAHKVYEGDWQPRRIVLLEFPSVEVWEAFYNGPTYQGLKAIRDACSSARLVGVEGA
jgi:uncharacterized protein (DUF1330 family)